MFFFSELAVGISRRTIFEIWKREKGAVWNYICEMTDFEKYENLDQIKIKKVINNFCANLRQKWTKCHRNVKLFVKCNESWLSGKIKFDIPRKKKSSGRPRKTFEECAESAKQKKVQHIVASFSKQELTLATSISLYSHGQRDAAEIIKKLSTSPKRATRLKKDMDTKIRKLPIKMSPDQALALYIDTKMSKHQYNRVKQSSKEHNADIYPNYNKLLEAKKRCYPAGIIISEISAEVPMQAIVDHTIDRLAIAQAEVLNHVFEHFAIASIKMYFKWGCDGAAGQSRYKQQFENEDSDDSFIFSISMVPLRMTIKTEKNEEVIVFQNPSTSSTIYCRPIKIFLKQEKEEFVKLEIENIKNQIQHLQPSPVKINQNIYHCTSILYLTMIDGKICSWLANSSAQNCHLCHAKPSQMNDIAAMKTRQVDAKNVELGISSLHAWIKCFECLLHISYRLDLKKWSVRKADKPAVDARKKYIQERFRREMGLLVDVPKPGFGTTNDGNSARKFFRSATTASAITGIDETLIKRFHIILTTLACGHEIDAEKLQKFCLETAELYVRIYPWYYMPQSIHKILIHGGILVNTAVLPIGQMSEEAQESRNKDSKHFREHHSRKFSRLQTLEDMMNMLLISSDPYITSLRKIKKRRAESLPQEVIAMLKMPQEARSDNESDDDSIDSN